MVHGKKSKHGRAKVKNLNLVPTTHSDEGSPTAVAPEPESTFNPVNDAEVAYLPGADYATIRHTRPWVEHQGTATIVPVTILGTQPLSAERRVYVQRQGWRTATFGWTIGGWLGGGIGKEVDVTPRVEESWTATDSVDTKKRREKYASEIAFFINSSAASPKPKEYKALETYMVHVPVDLGGSFVRVRVYPTESSAIPIASTMPFRIGSESAPASTNLKLSVSDVINFAIGLLLKYMWAVWSITVWMCFFSAYPALKFAQITMGEFGNKSMDMAYGLAKGWEVENANANADANGRNGNVEKPDHRQNGVQPNGKHADGKNEGVWFKHS